MLYSIFRMKFAYLVYRGVFGLASLFLQDDTQNDLEESLLQKNQLHSSEVCEEFINAGTWSHLTFQWLNPIFRRGRSQKIELSHIPSVPESEKAEKASLILEESLRKENINLPKAIIHAVGKSLSINAAFAVSGVNVFASYVGPVLIASFINLLLGKHDGSRVHYGLILASAFFFSKTVESLTQRQWYFGAQRIGIRVRTALVVLIYKNSLSIKHTAPNSSRTINLVNADVERIGDFCWHVHGIWLLPIQVLLALVILYINLGAVPSVTAVSATILVMVCNTPLVHMQKGLQSKIMTAKDSRIKVTSETLKSTRVLKMQSWESSFLKKLLQLRETEVSWLRKHFYSCSAVAFLLWASPSLVSVVTFGACILDALQVPAKTAFMLKDFPTAWMIAFGKLMFSFLRDSSKINEAFSAFSDSGTEGIDPFSETEQRLQKQSLKTLSLFVVLQKLSVSSLGTLLSANSILYNRGVYPEESSVKVNKYGHPKLVTQDEGVRTIIRNLNAQLSEWLEAGKL
ncbi:ABC transporter C family member 3 [Quillaja saponaria]|uniref:ABC transporter C family member 3 n=1 Tax=Quillaja saponaria TaxID=32244 RepID=A0AAD7P8B6_QUISA|nr:ABC transporter C family member 3 [Quillaja saponaria]